MRTPRALLVTLALGFSLASVASARLAFAEEAPAASAKNARGRPKVVLDRLVFPADVANSATFEKHLRLMLAREARRADWGAARGTRIEYRFTVSELGIREHADVLRVRCTAFGKLPSGKTAKSHLDFGGDPRARSEVVKRVLEMVARGVITRLAELERVRRGELDRTHVRLPRSGDVD
ncbi:MAG TPA: hypothetical protein VK524_03770 [Polyangiaceae bacterium]|nr:hypothetical protein [Polyangiaceae bacterium]